MLDKATTGAGITLGIVGLVLSPAAMEKISSEHFFWFMLAALILTALGGSIIPAIKAEPKVTKIREKRDKKVVEAIKEADVKLDHKIEQIVDDATKEI